MNTILIALYLGLLGLCLGSFVNAAVWRIYKHKDIVKDRSECVHCHHKLAWYDLVPVFSWMSLKGRCRYCKKSISWQYPLVELAVMLFFVVSFLLWPVDLTTWSAIAQFVLWLTYGVMLAILFVYDLRWFLLPNVIVYPLIVLGFIDALIRVGTAPEASFLAGFTDIILSAAVIGGVYGALYWMSKGAWVGFGDVKLGLFMGLALGWQQAIICLFAANLIGFLVILPGLLSGKISRTTRIPFGPFLIIGFIIAGLWGQAILDWYMTGLPFLFGSSF